ncbi:Ger(x)C family spore germination protein [Bacillus lacus]|uniref:Ger(X)C family spore germination protein n=1 Tax=Metabacillus lacus TaxID=1983721 RepID=A0A7X2J078_9BACI|nr:Ger(x)C family spore germination protein [Metabacillus lacus]
MNLLKSAAAICLVFMLSGCWDLIEINKLSIVTGIAIEKGENAKYKLTVETVNESEMAPDGGEGNAPVTLYSQEGNSISALINRLNEGLMRRLIYSHTRVIVLDESVAKEGLNDILDFLDRTGEFRNDFSLLISKGNKASDIISITYPIRKVPSLKLDAQIESLYQDYGGVPEVRLTDFIHSITTEGRHPVALAVSIEGDPKAGGSVENNKQISNETRVLLDGIGLFKNDKLQGYLDIEESRNYLWTQDLKATTVSYQCNAKEDKFAAARVSSSHSSMRVTKHNGKYTLHVDNISETRLHGTQCPLDLSKQETYDQITEELEKVIGDGIKETIQKVQQDFQSDIFGFGETYYRSNYKDFQNIKHQWDEIFSEAEVDVNIKVRLRRSGVRGESFLNVTTDEEQ